jgi:copper chaperone NosL
MFKIISVLILILLTACDKPPSTVIPAANTLTREASGYYCLMTVLNHQGPKGQIILSDNKVLWFTSVRDTISFTLSPEEPKNIAAIYVNDMSEADWDNPGINNWIDANKAWFVVGSKRTGGMGSPEAVPFSTKEHAEKFISQLGGAVYTFDSIPPEFFK